MACPVTGVAEALPALALRLVLWLLHAALGAYHAVAAAVARLRGGLAGGTSAGDDAEGALPSVVALLLPAEDARGCCGPGGAHEALLRGAVARCAALGARRVLVYDPAGVMAAEGDQLRVSLASEASGAEVLLLGPADGREPLVQAARHISSCINGGDEGATEGAGAEGAGQRMVERVSEALETAGAPPDPQLALVLASRGAHAQGGACSPLGFPPWQLRLTEFAELPPLTELRDADIRAAFERYAMIEQRCGK